MIILKKLLFWVRTSMLMIDEQFLDYQIPTSNYEYKPLVNTSIFGDHKPTKVASQVPKSWDGNPNTSPNPSQLKKLRKLQETPAETSPKEALIELPSGTKVEHQRFGKGVVVQVEGSGNDKKATIKFAGVGEKKLLLRFAKLKILS